jgi:type IX secretion system PorP/SprF family membrane protein
MKSLFKIKLLLVNCCLMIASIMQAQDIHFSQFFEAPLLRNPSLAGIFSGDIRIQAVYRDQWNSVTNAYKTGSLNAEYKMPVGKGDDFLTAGLQLLFDRAGTVAWTSSHVLPALNFHKSLSDQTNRYLSLGFMGGIVQRKIDRSKIITNSTYDGLGDGETFTDNQYSYFDGAVGMSFNTQFTENADNNLFIGGAYHHFNKPKNSFYQNSDVELEPKMVGSAGVKFSVTPASYITLQTDYSKQGRYREVVAGALYGIKIGEGDLDDPLYTLHGGAFLRLNDALIPVIKLDYHKYSLSFSYDVNISKLKTSSYGRGGFELGISYVGFTNRDNSALNAVWCPRF